MENNQKRITLKQIASELGYSISTVSKALKNYDDVSSETRLAVRTFAKFYNYRPNQAALSLRHGYTNSIGVLIPSVEHFFFSGAFQGIEKFAAEYNYNVILSFSNGSLEKEMHKIKMLANSNIDGFIISPSAETRQKKYWDHLNEINRCRRPLVLLNRVVEIIECDAEIMDYRKNAYKAVKRMIKKGQKRIAIAVDQKMSNSFKEALKGYKDALKDYGMHEEIILELPEIEAKKEGVTIFQNSTEIDAALCVNRATADYLAKLLNREELHTPQDISRIGYSNEIGSQSETIPSTRSSQWREQKGREAAKLLIEKIENKPPTPFLLTKAAEEQQTQHMISTF